MKGQFLLASHEAFIEHNIYADKSSLILDWLLHQDIKKAFSIREVAREIKISVGLEKEDKLTELDSDLLIPHFLLAHSV